MFESRFRDDDTARVRAAALLVTTGALVELSAADARTVVGYMQPHRVPAGTVLMRQGERAEKESMALILSGEVTVENEQATRGHGMVVSVLGPGSVIGELGLIDQSARSATCTATTDLALAVFSSEALMQLLDEKPAVAARLLMALAKRIADHLRESNRKLLAMAGVGKALQQELDAAHSVNRRLVEQLRTIERKPAAARG